uniref:Protein tincar n=1 Tax=Haemonchus placei TaxID=6290 RepID=A0A0N4WP23_HAEPC
LSIALCLSLFISVITLAIYYWRDRGVYEELIDYLDKTISISKINYNHLLGLYQLSDKEVNVLSEERTYKTILGCYLLGDLACYICLVLAIILYFTSNVSKSRTFQVILCIGVLYCICEVHLFTFMLMPYSAALPNSTEQLLNHAIPHNPGGLMQMEQRLGCTFDHNLYAANKRRLNPRNTCDPQIESSFIPRFVLVFLLVLRLLPIVVCALLLAKRTPLSESIAMLVERLTPTRKKTSAAGTPLPPIPSPTHIDHN